VTARVSAAALIYRHGSTAMTLYSTLPTGAGKITVLATWAGEYDASHSAKVTTLSDDALAARLAEDLTRVSEAMWDAAAWLDVYDLAEARVAEIVDAARGAGDVPYVSESMFAGCRHAESWTGVDLSNGLSAGLTQTLNSLTRAQRLSVADELVADADARAQSLVLLATGHDPSDPASRIWQAADIGRATKLGLTGYLPDGAAGWMVRTFDAQHGPAERWGARDMLHRLEQLDAAAKTVNARGGAELDDFTGPLAHIVLPAQLFGVHIDHSGKAKTRVRDDIDPAVAGSALAEAYRDYARTATWVDGDAVLYIGPEIDIRKVAPWDRDVFAKIGIDLAVEGGKRTLATLEATDTAGFVAALGTWVTAALYRG
jgi:hypothetical protein